MTTPRRPGALLIGSGREGATAPADAFLAADPDAFAALGGQHVGMAGVSVAPAQVVVHGPRLDGVVRMVGVGQGELPRRHLGETLRGRALAPGLDDYIADQALARHGRQLTVPQEGRRAPAPDQITHTADFPWPARWWIASIDGKPPRAATRYERARVASLALQNAIRAARATPAARDDTPAAATASAAAHQAAAAPYAVDHPDRDAALTPAQQVAAVHAHQQAAMSGEYLEGRTTDPATWMHTPENLSRLAAFTREADARRRTIAERQQPEQSTADAADAADQQQHHTPRPDQGRGAGRER